MFNLILSMMIGAPILCAIFGQGIDKDIVTLMIELSFACIMLIVWVFVWVDSRYTDPPVIKEVIPSITAQQGEPYTGFPGKRYIEEEKQMAKKIEHPIGTKVYVTDNAMVYPHARQVIPKRYTFAWGYQPENGQKAMIVAKNEIRGRCVYICDTGEKVFVIGAEGVEEEKQMARVIKTKYVYSIGIEYVLEQYQKRYKAGNRIIGLKST